jgi:sugar lactone lactonase YvrE
MGVYLLEQLAKTSLGEGPSWDGASSLMYIDMVNGEIHHHNFEKHTHAVLRIGSSVGFAVPDNQGGIVAGLSDGIYRIAARGGGKELIARSSRTNSENCFNDGKCDRVGRLWAGTKNIHGPGRFTGSLYRLDRRDWLTEVLFPVDVSNGIAWSPDNLTMYYNDSTDRIWRFDYDLQTGEATHRQSFVELLDDRAVPDGMTVDSQGRLFCAMWGGSRVDVYNPDGGLDEQIPVPALQVSSVAFGGPDLKTLFITTAAMDLTVEQRNEWPLSGGIFAMQRSVAGLREWPVMID